jgi:hypothetical protein
MVLRKQCHKRHLQRKMAKQVTELTSQENQPLSNSLLVQSPLNVPTDQTAVRFEAPTATTSKATTSYAVRYVPVIKKQ